MKKLFLVLAVLVLLIAGQALPVSAQEESVSVTLQLAEVSISLSPGTVDYGIVQLGSTNNKPIDDPWIVAANTGTAWVEMSIKGDDTDDGGGGGWTLAGSAGVETYVHKFGVGGVGYTPLSTSYDGLGSYVSIAPLAIIGFKLQMDGPTSSSSLAVQSTSVTVMATMVAEGITVIAELDEPSYPEGTPTALVTATVTNADDSPVTGLSASNFFMWIGGNPATITWEETAPGSSGIYEGTLDISGLSQGSYLTGVTVDDGGTQMGFSEVTIEITAP